MSMPDSNLSEAAGPASSDRARPLGRRERLLAPDSTFPTWAGLVVAALGFVLLAVGWGKVAGLTNVALQVPYLVSAGFSGLGLIAVGCTLISVQARRQDAAARDARLSELHEVLEVLERLAGDGPPSPSSAAADSPAPKRVAPRRRAPRKTTTRS